MKPLANLGISGKLTRATIQSPLTPLMLLAAIIVGLIATITIPREEEPQIDLGADGRHFGDGTGPVRS